MKLLDINPNFVTFANILPACVTIGALEEGMDMYAKFGRLYKV